MTVRLPRRSSSQCQRRPLPSHRGPRQHHPPLDFRPEVGVRGWFGCSWVMVRIDGCVVQSAYDRNGGRSGVEQRGGFGGGGGEGRGLSRVSLYTLGAGVCMAWFLLHYLAGFERGMIGIPYVLGLAPAPILLGRAPRSEMTSSSVPPPAQANSTISPSKSILTYIDSSHNHLATCGKAHPAERPLV